VVLIRCGQLNLGDTHAGDTHDFPFEISWITTLGLVPQDFQQSLDDKFAKKLPPWPRKYITMAGRTSLLNSVISLQAIYYLTPLVVPSGTLSYVNMLKRAFI
jgi:hypothetical protein